MIAKLLLLAALQGPVQVTTFNIRYDNPRDGLDAWPNRRDDVIAWLRAEQPDIIGVQEALRRQLDDLAVLGYGEVGVGRDDGRTGGEYAAILYRRERFEVLESGTFWFSDTPDVPGSRSWGNNVTRICTWARFSSADGPFYVFNVHLDHESQPSRERSVAALLAAMGPATGNDPVIVTGDFNAGPGNPAVQAMTAQFVDTYASRDTLDGTFNGFREDSLGPKIDFIFVNRAIGIRESHIARPRTGTGRHLSDHFPVVARLVLRPSVEVTNDVLEMVPLTVSATRIDRRVEDQALRVEVVEPEEVEEKLAMTPGDISMLLNETGGLRVASTAPGTGGANVRIHGLRGRYTGILADGLPLYGESGALSILQIPPMDLMQVEIVKGPASAMYGGAALGGLVNLVSRRPRESSRELLLNGTTLGGADAVSFLSQPLGGPWGATLLAGAHHQEPWDVDDDDWRDVAAYDRVTLRPRLHYEDGAGRRLFATLGVMAEDREGGMMDNLPAPDSNEWREGARSRRFDVGLSGATRIGSLTWSARGSAMLASHRHWYGPALDPDRHATGLLEITAGSPAGRAGLNWLGGVAFTFDRFRSDSVARLDYNHTAPALFGQLDASGSTFAAQLSARADFHSQYGTQLSPRLSVLWRLRRDVSLRVSAARGFFAPTPFVEAADAVGLRRLVVLGPLRAEHATVLSLDLALPVGPVAANVTLFTSRISDPVLEVAVVTTPDQQAFGIANGVSARSIGADVVARYSAEPWHATASWTYTWSRESLCAACEVEAALNPRMTGGLVAAWEHDGWRVGSEFYLTGSQRLEVNPDLARSPAYAVVGLLAQRRLGSALLFLNLENLTDARVTRTHGLLLPSRSPRTGWTTDVWGPLEGRVINGGIRLAI